MPLRRLRGALALAVLAPLLVAPLAVQARSGPLTCPGVAQTGLWQRLAVEDFREVPSVSTRNAVTGWALDATRPRRLLVTNGNTVKASDSHGCAWEDVLVLAASGTDAVPLSGTTSTVVAVAHLPGGRGLAAVREGTGPASRPHVVSSDSGARDSWRETSQGLPLQGSPRLLEPAGDGRTAYLALDPVRDAGGNGGSLPTLPGAGAEQATPAGLLYASTDGGRSWVQRTTPQALPSGVTGFDALAVDAADPELVYAVSGGRLVVSRDGGRTLRVADPEGVTAVEPMEAGEVAVLVGSGQLLHSRDAGTTFTGRPAPAGAGSAAYRAGDGSLVVEADGALHLVDARGRAGVQLLDAGAPATRGSARGDRAADGSFHALSGNAVLRYVDPAAPATQVDAPRVLGDLTAPPPPPGRMSPPAQSVSLPVGTSRLVDFTLVQPRSPTPLDLYLLLDVSESMNAVLEDLKRNLDGVADDIVGEGVDLRVGLGTVAAGPREGEAPYPESDPREPDYRKPDVYKRVREVGEVNADLRTALRGVQISKPPPGRRGELPPEGGLVGLDQLREGEGVRDRRPGAELTGGFVVPPGQQAGFRAVPGVRRVVVLATDEPFTDPYGVRRKPDGSLDVEGVAADLKAAGIQQVGLAAEENAASKSDLQRMAALTGTFAPPGGVHCGDEVFVPAGAPLVCDTSQNFSKVLSRLVLSLADRQSVRLVPRGATPVLGDVDAAALRDLDVTVANEIPFRVRVSCAGVAAGSHTAALDAVLRGTTVATAQVDVTCTPLAAAAVPPPRPPAPQVQEPVPPAAQPGAPAPVPPAPAPPVAQAQTQVQVQTQVQAQVQPLTAAALQQQEQLQLALALQADEAAPRNELAMVDRGRSAELRALALLAVSMGVASAAGLARLRTRQEQVVRVGRRP